MPINILVKKEWKSFANLVIPSAFLSVVTVSPVNAVKRKLTSWTVISPATNLAATSTFVTSACFWSPFLVLNHTHSQQKIVERLRSVQKVITTEKLDDSNATTVGRINQRAGSLVRSELVLLTYVQAVLCVPLDIFFDWRNRRASVMVAKGKG